MHGDFNITITYYNITLLNICHHFHSLIKKEYKEYVTYKTITLQDTYLMAHLFYHTETLGNIPGAAQIYSLSTAQDIMAR